MEKDNEKVKEEMKELIEKLKEVDPIDPKHNPFVILPSEDLKDIKKTIEEFAEELTPKLYDS